MMLRAGVGVGWRPHLAMHIERRKDLRFIELMAENLTVRRSLPRPVRTLIDRGVQTVIHGVSLSLGGATRPSAKRLADLESLASVSGAVLVSEHIAFVRAGGLEAGHLLPVERTEESLRVIVENINYASQRLPVPLAIENIAALFEWPNNSIEEPVFISRILSETDALLLLDVSNLYANATNNGYDPVAFARKLPLERVAYLHIAGGIKNDDIYLDTHAHAVGKPVLSLMDRILELLPDARSVLLERDDCFPMQAELDEELDYIATSIETAARRRAMAHV